MCVCAQSLSGVWLCDPMGCSPPGSSFHGISRQGYWNKLLFPAPVALPDPGIEPVSLFFFYFTILYWFAIHQHASAMGVHVFPILNPPPTSLPILSLWVVPVQQPQASYILHQTWTDDSFLIWYYTCFNVILPNHPPPPPQSPKDCPIHLCLFCCLAYRVVITIFLNS